MYVRECLPGFYSLLGKGLCGDVSIYLLRDVFSLVSVAAENLMDVCLAIKHSFEISSVVTLG